MYEKTLKGCNKGNEKYNKNLLLFTNVSTFEKSTMI